jgi:hypothetical protein
MNKKPATKASVNVAPTSGKIGLPLGFQNYKLMLIGFVIIVLGFILMSGGKSTDPNVFAGEQLYSFRRITLAPIVVIFGFMFEIYAIMKLPKAS